MAVINSFAKFFGANYPTEDQVAQDVAYGDSQNEFVGTLDPGAGGPYPGISDVRYGVAYGTTQVGLAYIPTPAQVLNGVNVDQTTGTVVLPGAGDVRKDVAYGPASGTAGVLFLPTEVQVLDGVGFGSNGTEYTGQLNLPNADDVRFGVDVGQTTGLAYIPTAAQVLLGVSVDQTTGTVRLPNADDVREAVDYGASDVLTGNVVLPPIGKVLNDTSYGSNGTEFTGSYDPGASGTIPQPDDVRFGVDVGQTTGLAYIPTPDKVLLGTSVDQTTGTYSTVEESNVRAGTNYGPSLSLTGTCIVPSPDDVRLGVDVDVTLTGNVVLPPENKVLDGTNYGTDGTEFNGAAGVIPSPDDVRVSVAVGKSVGTVKVPIANNVRLGVATDTSLTGTILLPDEGDVRDSVGYGANGTEFSGVLVVGAGTPVYPSPNHVRLGQQYGTEGVLQFTGNVILPTEPQVALGIAYDSLGSRIGELDPKSGIVLKVY